MKSKKIRNILNSVRIFPLYVTYFSQIRFLFFVFNIFVKFFTNSVHQSQHFPFLLQSSWTFSPIFAEGFAVIFYRKTKIWTSTQLSRVVGTVTFHPAALFSGSSCLSTVQGPGNNDVLSVIILLFLFFLSALSMSCTQFFFSPFSASHPISSSAAYLSLLLFLCLSPKTLPFSSAFQHSVSFIFPVYLKPPFTSLFCPNVDI
jgi:hypothetical protein